MILDQGAAYSVYFDSSIVPTIDAVPPRASDDSETKQLKPLLRLPIRIHKKGRT